MSADKRMNHHPELLSFYAGDSVAFLDHRATACVTVACEAIQTLTAVPLQRELEDAAKHSDYSAMDGRVAIGLPGAVACCVELVNTVVTGSSPSSIGMTAFLIDSPAAVELMRETALKAGTMRLARVGRSGDRRGAA